ncbi:MAG: NnrU family protein [Parvularculaceae bacterium]
MALFLLGLLVFFGSHLFTAFARRPRAALVARIGEGPYKGLYSLVALAGFVLIAMGWPRADASVLYVSPDWMRGATYVLVLIAFVLFAAAYAPAGRIAGATKHPMLAGLKIWAFAHLLVNGEVRSLILFGSFLAYAVVDRIAVKRRDAPTRAAGPLRNDAIAVAVGLAGYLAVALYGHRYIAGVGLY